MTKRKPRLYRDSHGRFVSVRLPENVLPGGHEFLVKVNVVPRAAQTPYCDAIYRPTRKSWLERVNDWLWRPRERRWWPL